MASIIKTLAVASLALGLTGLAQAAPITTITAGPTTSIAGATTIDFESGCGYITCTGDFQIFTDSVANESAQPVDSTGDFLSVPNPESTGSATFELDGEYNYFGLLWGSVDEYNDISFFLNDVLIAFYSGSDFVDPAEGDQQASVFVNFFFGSQLFDEIELSSDGFAFESDNHAYANVPEPGSLALLGLGLVGLGMARREARA